MPVELLCVGLAGVLLLVQIFLAAVPRALTAPAWAAGPRDSAAPAVSDRAQRADRALRNMAETFPIFAAAAIAVVAAQRTTELTALGAQLYLVARLIYVPAYVFHVPFVRSLIWGAAIVGLLLVLSPFAMELVA